MEQQQIIFDEYLQKKWNDLYDENKNIFRSQLDSMQIKQIGKFFAYFNSEQVNNKRQPTFQIDSDQQFSLLAEFEPNQFNFTKVKDEEILFYLELDNLEIYDKQQKMQSEDEYELHPIMTNISPILKYACIVSPFVQDQLPQFLGTDLLMTILETFKFSSKNDFRYYKLTHFLPNDIFVF